MLTGTGLGVALVELGFRTDTLYRLYWVIFQFSWSRCPQVSFWVGVWSPLSWQRQMPWVSRGGSPFLTAGVLVVTGRGVPIGWGLWCFCHGWQGVLLGLSTGYSAACTAIDSCHLGVVPPGDGYKPCNIFSKSFSILLRGSRIFSKFWRNFCKKEKLLHFMFFWQYVSAISQFFGFWIEFGYLYFDINAGCPDICIESSLKMISKITWKP